MGKLELSSHTVNDGNTRRIHQTKNPRMAGEKDEDKDNKSHCSACALSVRADLIQGFKHHSKTECKWYFGLNDSQAPGLHHMGTKMSLTEAVRRNWQKLKR